MNFFKYYKVLLLKTKKNLKKDGSHVEIAWRSKRQKKTLKKKERKTKNGKKSNNIIKIFFQFYSFVQKKLHFVRNHIWKSLVYVVTFIWEFFHVTRVWKYSNKTATLMQICTGFVDTVLRPKILGNRLDYLNVDFD